MNPPMIFPKQTMDDVEILHVQVIYEILSFQIWKLDFKLYPHRVVLINQHPL